MTLGDIDIAGFDTVLLDRDGTINRQRQGDYVKCWDEFEFLPGVLDAIARFARTAKHIFIVTNQRGVGRGRMTQRELEEIHSRMCHVIRAHGGRIDGIYCSFGLDETDPSRKPNTGMWHKILAEHPDVEAAGTLMVGDGDCDMAFAENCGIKGLRVDKQNVIFIKESTD